MATKDSTSPTPHHRRHPDPDKKLNDDNEERDPFDMRLEESGCSRYHYELQECYFEHNDWRKCQKEMKAFHECMQRNKDEKKIKKKE